MLAPINANGFDQDCKSASNEHSVGLPQVSLSDSVDALTRALGFCDAPAPTPQTSVIHQLEEEYRSSLTAIDGEVKALIQQGREMTGLVLLTNQLSKIIEVHGTLTNLYALVWRHQAVLKRFCSERLRQLGHEPKAICKFVTGTDLPQDIVERRVLEALKSVGFQKEHWYIEARILTEIEYMIEALKILVEPGFQLLAGLENREDGNEKPDRYIPSAVKVSVWRRDEGKCAECKSNEKLEYDHIIPVSRGGSNTERNIQLLCERCNRKKSAQIQ